MRLTRRAALGGLFLGTSVKASAKPGPDKLNWSGKPQQGGFAILRATPGAAVEGDGTFLAQTGAGGLAVIGFDRDATGVTRVAAGGAAETLAIAPVAYDVQRIDGLPTDQVEPSDPALLARIKSELARKTAAIASREDTEDFRDGFIWPLEHAVRTSKFGPQRILNGVPKTPHYGVDLAAPAGTPIRAPAPGRVAFADPAMHFEGGLTLIDHGQGLISAYLHQSAQSVRAGERVERGQVIGRVGSTGRATGPHLCWRLTWRGRHMDPSLMVGASAPA